jgi:hypothetical protein
MAAFRLDGTTSARDSKDGFNGRPRWPFFFRLSVENRSSATKPITSFKTDYFIQERGLISQYACSRD